MIVTVATGNVHKLEEMRDINKHSSIVLQAVQGDFDPDENGETFAENAFIKAKAASLIVKDYAFADDSGLCVEYLNGRPGLHTARYAPTQAEKIAKMLKELDGVPFEKRSARFECHMALTDKNGLLIYETCGIIEGYIAEKAAGVGGFGYDPIFFVKEYGKTLAELPEHEKNKISHRTRALLPMLGFIETLNNK